MNQKLITDRELIAIASVHWTKFSEADVRALRTAVEYALIKQREVYDTLMSKPAAGIK